MPVGGLERRLRGSVLSGRRRILAAVIAQQLGQGARLIPLGGGGLDRLQSRPIQVELRQHLARRQALQLHVPLLRVRHHLRGCGNTENNDEKEYDRGDGELHPSFPLIAGICF